MITLPKKIRILNLYKPKINFMKKSLLFITSIVLLNLGNAFAQIPNAGFEKWSKNTFGAKDPDGWFSLNLLSVTGLPIGVTATDQAHSGDSALKMTVDEYTPFLSTKKDTSVAYCFTGKLKELSKNGGQPGFPYTSRPTFFTGFYKLTLPKPDQAMIGVALTKWNAAIQKRDTLGFTNSFFDVATSTYKDFTSPIFYILENAMPDTAIIYIISSISKQPIPGTTLYIDDLKFTGGITGASAGLSSLKTSVYPNPAASEINIENVAPGVVSIHVLDVAGKVVAEQSVMENNSIQYSVDQLNNGMYFFELKNSNKQLVQRGKFTVGK